ERWEEKAFQDLPATPAVTPGEQVRAALAEFPDAHFHSYRLPQYAGDAALVHLTLTPSGRMRDVFVSPQGVVLGSLDSSRRIVEVARRIHGQLLLGTRGGWVVELVACWAIVMLITGACLWWPRGRGAAGVIWPRRRMLLRDLHAVTGFWVSAFAMVLLLTGLPWTDVWGRSFQAVREQAGWVLGAPQWNIGDAPAPAPAAHSGHDHGAMDTQHGDGAHAQFTHFDA